MAQSRDYKVKLYPAHKEGNFAVTKFEAFGTYPEKSLSAAGMPDLIDQVTHFALVHGEGCQASVRCLALRNPPGFKKATEDLFFNLTEGPVAVDQAII